MFHSDPADWPIATPAFEGEARSIGTILSGMRDVAALRMRQSLARDRRGPAGRAAAA